MKVAGLRWQVAGGGIRVPLILILLIIPVCLFASEVSVSMKLENPVLYIGETGSLQVIVTGSRKGGTVSLTEVPGLKFEKGRTSSQTSIINGNVSASVTYSYLIEADKQGTFTIPGARVAVEGKTYTAGPAVLTVSKPPKTNVYLLKQEFKPAACYVFEPVVYEFTILASRSITGQRISVPFFRQEIGNNNQENFKFELIAGQQDEIFQIGGVKLPFRRSTIEIDGTVYTAFTGRLKVTPLVPGSYTFGPAGGKIQSDEVQGYTGDLIRRRLYKVYRVAGDPVSLEVRNVPSAGKPDGYTGAVGKLTVSLKLSSASGSSSDSGGVLKVYTAEPLTLEFSVGGSGIIEKMNPPDFKKYLPEASFAVSDDIEAVYDEKADVKAFTLTVRVLDSSIRTFPSIEYHFFDVGNGAYRTVKTPPINLQVEKTETVSAENIEDYSGGSRQEKVKGEQLRIQEGGLAENYRGDIVLEDDEYLFFVSPLFLMITAVPLILLGVNIAGYRLYRKGREDTAAQKRKKALSRAAGMLKNVRKSEDWHSLLGDTLRTYLGDRLGCNSSSLTPEDAGRILEEKRVDPDSVTRFKDLIAVCDAGRYGGTGDVDKDKTVRDAGVVLKRINGLLKKTIILICFLLPVSIYASEENMSYEALSELERSADGAYKGGMEALKVGDNAGARTQFRKALVDYKSILKNGIANGYLYYNIGNCSMRLDSIGEAVYYYRMGLRHLPRENRIRENYRRACQLRKDAIEPDAGDKLFKALFFWHYQTGLKGKMIVLLISSLLCMAAGLLSLYYSVPFSKTVTVCGGILFVILVISASAQYSAEAPGKQGVVITDVPAFKTSAMFSEKFETDLHEGAEFDLLKTDGDNLHVRLQDGRACWIVSSAVKLLY